MALARVGGNKEKPSTLGCGSAVMVPLHTIKLIFDGKCACEMRKKMFTKKTAPERESFSAKEAFIAAVLERAESTEESRETGSAVPELSRITPSGQFP